MLRMECLLGVYPCRFILKIFIYCRKVHTPKLVSQPAERMRLRWCNSNSSFCRRRPLVVPRDDRLMVATAIVVVLLLPSSLPVGAGAEEKICDQRLPENVPREYARRNFAAVCLWNTKPYFNSGPALQQTGKVGRGRGRHIHIRASPEVPVPGKSGLF